MTFAPTSVLLGNVLVDPHDVSADTPQLEIKEAETSSMPCIVSLDGSGELLTATRTTFAKEEVLDAVSRIAMQQRPSGSVLVAPTLLDIVSSVEGVESAAFDDESAIEVVASATDRAELLIRIDRVLRAQIGADANSVSIYLS